MKGCHLAVIFSTDCSFVYLFRVLVHLQNRLVAVLPLSFTSYPLCMQTVSQLSGLNTFSHSLQLVSVLCSQCSFVVMKLQSHLITVARGKVIYRIFNSRQPGDMHKSPHQVSENYQMEIVMRCHITLYKKKRKLIFDEVVGRRKESCVPSKSQHIYSGKL